MLSPRLSFFTSGLPACESPVHWSSSRTRPEWRRQWQVEPGSWSLTGCRHRAARCWPTAGWGSTPHSPPPGSLSQSWNRVILFHLHPITDGLIAVFPSSPVTLRTCPPGAALSRRPSAGASSRCPWWRAWSCCWRWRSARTWVQPSSRRSWGPADLQPQGGWVDERWVSEWGRREEHKATKELQSHRWAWVRSPV